MKNQEGGQILFHITFCHILPSASGGGHYEITTNENVPSLSNKSEVLIRRVGLTQKTFRTVCLFTVGSVAQ